jgi:hypothetical protein
MAMFKLWTEKMIQTAAANALNKQTYIQQCVVQKPGGWAGAYKLLSIKLSSHKMVYRALDYYEYSSELQTPIKSMEFD